MARKNTQYINNKTLYSAMIQHKNSVESAEKEGLPKPQVARYIGESILLICNNLAKKPNFSGYTYKQDMISDGIMDCIAAVDNFNPDKTNNPFAYFTQIAWNAFLRRIQKEKKQTYIKHKNYENNILFEENWEHSTPQLKTNEYSDEVVRNYEKKLTKPKKQSKIVGIELFSEEKVDE